MPKLISTTTEAKHKKVFHTDKSCTYLSKSYREVSEHEIEYHNLTECNKCSDGPRAEQPSKQDMSYYNGAVNAGKKRQ